MRKLAFSLLFFISTANPAGSSSIISYAAQELCAQDNDPETCFNYTVSVVAHDYLYVYARVLSNKKSLLPDWASYCKNRELPTFCMSVFERDYDNFKTFVLGAVNNNESAEKIRRCHKNLTIDSYTATRNKQCIYQ